MENNSSPRLITTKPTPGTRSSPTSVQDSIGIAKASRGFWTSSLTTKSQELWYPTKTGCAALPSSSWNASWSALGQNSWFTTKRWQPLQGTEKEKALQQRWRTMFWPSSTSLLPETTASEQDATAAEGSKKRPLPEDKDATPRPPKKRKERADQRTNRKVVPLYSLALESRILICTTLGYNQGKNTRTYCCSHRPWG